MSKSILFISPDAFGYYKNIKSTMELLGYEVDWHNHIPNSNSFVKGISRLFPSFVSVYSDSYFDKNILWGKSYDVVIVIKGESVSSKTLKKMREKFSGAEFIYYNWDSFSNVKDGLKKKKYFDKVSSFDPLDCENYPDIEHLPLFYLPEYSNISDLNTVKYKYISFFIGTIHSERYEYIEKLSRELELSSGMKAFRYYFYANKLIFRINKIFSKAFRTVPISDVKFKPLLPKKIAGYLEESKLVIDICHSKQAGLTMRTIECLGMKKKLITNNRNVLNYDFYHQDNILLIDDELTIPKDFINSPYHELPEALYSKYSIYNWTKTLLGI